MKKLLTIYSAVFFSVVLNAAEWHFPLQTQDDLKGWSGGSAKAVSIAEGGFQYYLPEKKKGVFTISKFFKPDELRGKIIRLSGERRGKDLIVPERNWLGPKIDFVTWGKKVGGFGVAGKFGSYDWEKFSQEFFFPYDTSKIQLRLGLQNGAGAMGVRNLKIETLGSALNIPEYANMGYVDKVAGDGKGGWSDQGPANDGRWFRWPHLGKKILAGVPFAPETKGNCIISMHSNYFKNGPEEVTIPFKGNENAKFFYLLHTTCYGSSKKDVVGTVNIKYSDGKTQEIKVTAKTDVDDWWDGKAVPNGALGVRARTNNNEWRVLYVSKFALNNTSKVESVTFRAVNPNTQWLISAATLTEKEYTLAMPLKKKAVRTKIVANKEWLPVERTNFNRRIKGSVLDLSAYNTHKPAGKEGRVIVNKDGHFAFEKSPDKAQRFLSAAINISDLENKWKADWLADELVKNGYNMVRFHFLDSFLMRGANHTAEFNSLHLDTFDYFISALKKRGIYVMLDIASSMSDLYSPYKTGYWGERLNTNPYRKRLTIFFDPEVKAEWILGAKKLLCRVNQYTKTRLIDDPVLAMVLGYNEQEFEFSRFVKKHTGIIAPHYQAFLKKKYSDISAYNKKWGTKYSSFEAIPCFTSREQGNTDVREFIYETEYNTSKWYKQQMRELGYKGLVTAYNLSKTHHFNKIRTETCDYVAINSYHAHPSNSFHSGSLISQESSISKSAGMFRDVIASRVSGKPHVVTEYKCAYWNKYRYEQPFVFGAYAAFQELDAINMYSTPVSLKSALYMTSFDSYTDPVTIVSEFLTFFMYRRGDVTPASKTVQIQVSEKQAKENPNVTLSKTQTSLALLNGYSQNYGESKTSGVLSFALSGYAKTAGTDWYSQTIDQNANLVPYIKVMKEKGFLPKNNRSNGFNIFENATSEIFMNTDKNFMSVNTPRLQGICAEAGTRYKLPDFEVKAMSVRGNLSVVALDGMKSIRDANRLMVVFSTNALTENVVFHDADMEKIMYQGRGRALLRAGKFSVALRNKNAANLKLYPIDLAGKRLKTIKPQKVSGDIAEFSVDTAKDGTAVFFEIAQK